MYLGIDVGTSAVKVCLASPEGGLVASTSAPLTVDAPKPYWSEQNPLAWWEAVKTAIGALKREEPRASDVAAIGLSGQMHGAVLLDERDAPIRPAILWNDGRSFLEAKALAAEDWIADMAGVPPLPGFTAPKVMWLKRNETDAYARIRKVLSPKDYVGFRLHGELVTDKSDAAGTLWLDQRARAWSEALCAASDTDPAWLPPCLEGVEAAGRLGATAAAELGLRPGAPIAAGGGDAAAGAMGLGATTDGASFISLGTSGQYFVATDAYRPNAASVVHAFAHCVPEMWFQMAAMLNGARPLSWFAAIGGVSVSDMLAEAATTKAADAPIFLPYLTGERTPHGDPHIRGGFFGLSDAMGRAELARGVAHAIAFSFADAADALRAAGTSLEPPLAIGGGARSDFLLQVIADVIEAPIIRRDGAASGPAFGAALLAMRAAGRDGPETVHGPETAFEPSGDRALAPQLETYRALYHATKNLAGRPGGG